MKKMLVISVLFLSTLAYPRRSTGDDFPAIGTTAEAWAEQEWIQQIPGSGASKQVQNPVSNTMLAR